MTDCVFCGKAIQAKSRAIEMAAGWFEPLDPGEETPHFHLDADVMATVYCHLDCLIRVAVAEEAPRPLS